MAINAIRPPPRPRVDVAADTAAPPSCHRHREQRSAEHDEARRREARNRALLERRAPSRCETRARRRPRRRTSRARMAVQPRGGMVVPAAKAKTSSPAIDSATATRRSQDVRVFRPAPTISWTSPTSSRTSIDGYAIDVSRAPVPRSACRCGSTRNIHCTVATATKTIAVSRARRGCSSRRAPVVGGRCRPA